MHPTTEPMITSILSGSVVPQNKNVEHIKDKVFFKICIKKRFQCIKEFYLSDYFKGVGKCDVQHLSFKFPSSCYTFQIC